jgi:hypothetical protein
MLNVKMLKKIKCGTQKNFLKQKKKLTRLATNNNFRKIYFMLKIIFIFIKFMLKYSYTI